MSDKLFCPSCISTDRQHPIWTDCAAPDTHRGWAIHQGRWPEPAWSAIHPDYDASYEGPEDGWVVTHGASLDAPTRDAVIEEIDAWIDEHSADAWPGCTLPAAFVAELIHRDNLRMAI